MRLITVAGSPSVGKTSVIVRTVRQLTAGGLRAGVIKFDALDTADHALYRRAGIPVSVGLSHGVCPDHFFVSNIDDARAWGEAQGFDVLVSESAGLCNRCSPHIRGVLAVCVVDALSGVHTPRKIGPMLRLADLVLITKGDIVSQAEREVFAHHVALANPRASVLFVNGITGQGSAAFADRIRCAEAVGTLEGARLRFPMPSAVCPYCVGETCIGVDHQRGHVRKIAFDAPEVPP
ncbi:Ni2+-binding GTPase involved in maturation of urease and hydrogenase [Azospirillum brasilense]|uniref:Hydrogenase maturation factor HypB n=1 Tax=Azospirillum brasilense TaxID=192 RepID=A0A560BC75_AZOBR|nr:GTP-binding protein [Azospirillum brasilense]TWA70183.1 Ni2+-binding GTPase involved in maturation of urease and hydrogenase [Azospirillum brasilense]